MDDDADWMTVEQAKRRLNVGEWTIRQAIKERRLPARRANRRGDLRIARTDFDRWVEKELIATAAAGEDAAADAANQ